MNFKDAGMHGFLWLLARLSEHLPLSSGEPWRVCEQEPRSELREENSSRPA